MGFTEEQGARYQSIIEFLSPPDGTATSSATLSNELEWNQSDTEAAVRELIAFGELELINVSQHGRVRLRQPTSSTSDQMTLGDNDQTIWNAYITEQDGLGRTRARRLFSSREPAEEHLKQMAEIDVLTSVPGVTDVWHASIGGHNPEYAVLRRELIFDEADYPYPGSK